MSPATARERGLSLVELLVTVVILGIFMTLFSSAVLSITKGVRQQSGVSAAQGATRYAFQILDKQIRYADAVTAPSTGTDPQWIEWRVPDPSIPVVQSSSQSRCFQWRATAGTGTLSYRSWIIPSSGPVSPPPWIPVATGLVIGSTPVFSTTTAQLQAPPFSLPVPGQSCTLAHSQVGVALSVSFNNPAGRSAVSTVFTALNSGASPAAVCTEVPRT